MKHAPLKPAIALTMTAMALLMRAVRNGSYTLEHSYSLSAYLTPQRLSQALTFLLQTSVPIKIHASPPGIHGLMHFH